LGVVGFAFAHPSSIGIVGVGDNVGGDVGGDVGDNVGVILDFDVHTPILYIV